MNERDRALRDLNAAENGLREAKAVPLAMDLGKYLQRWAHVRTSVEVRRIVASATAAELDAFLSTLTPNEEKVLRLRFGIGRTAPVRDAGDVTLAEAPR